MIIEDVLSDKLHEIKTFKEELSVKEKIIQKHNTTKHELSEKLETMHASRVKKNI